MRKKISVSLVFLVDVVTSESLCPGSSEMFEAFGTRVCLCGQIDF